MNRRALEACAYPDILIFGHAWNMRQTVCLLFNLDELRHPLAEGERHGRASAFPCCGQNTGVNISTEDQKWLSGTSFSQQTMYHLFISKGGLLLDLRYMTDTTEDGHCDCMDAEWSTKWARNTEIKLYQLILKRVTGDLSPMRCDDKRVSEKND